MISQDSHRPDWVDYGFKANLIRWTSDKKVELNAQVRGIMMSAIGKKYVNNKGKGNGLYFGKLGDVVNLTDGIIVSGKKFQEVYKIL